MINTAEVIDTVRGILIDEKARFFKEPFLVRAINQASLFAFAKLQHAREHLFLDTTGITITEQNVSDGVTDYSLPENCSYVSDKCDFRRDPVRDYRPLYNNSRLIAHRHYEVTLDKFRFLTAPTVPGTVQIWYKAPPASITKQGKLLIAWPGFAFNYFVAYLEWIATRRDEEEDANKSTLVIGELNTLRQIIINQMGRPERINPEWDMIDRWTEDA